jgi:hypothetical protein
MGLLRAARGGSALGAEDAGGFEPGSASCTALPGISTRRGVAGQGRRTASRGHFTVQADRATSGHNNCMCLSVWAASRLDTQQLTQREQWRRSRLRCWCLFGDLRQALLAVHVQVSISGAGIWDTRQRTYQELRPKRVSG